VTPFGHVITCEEIGDEPLGRAGVAGIAGVTTVSVMISKAGSIAA
jgi:hypothetical protein